MRVLFTPLPAKSHIYHMIPMAWALRAAGHEVCIAAEPGLADEITRCGVTAVQVGEDVNMGMGRQRPAQEQNVFDPRFNISETRPEKLTWDYVHGVFDAWCSSAFEYLSNKTILDDLVDFVRSWQPDLVVWDALMYAGPVAARASGTAQVRMLFAVDHLARMREVFLELSAQRPVQGRVDPLVDWLSGKLARYGCEYDQEVLFGARSIDSMPSFMRFPVNLDYLPVRYVPYNGPTVLPEWLRTWPSRPRVVLTLGMSTRELHGDEEFSVSDLFDAVRGLDIELVATLSSSQLAGASSVPENVRPVDFVPLNELLPTCSVAIHHGGTGTIGNSVVHGVPQLIIPGSTWGEADAARALAGRGAGLVLAPEQFSADTLRSHLVRMLEEPAFQRTAAEVRTEMLATPSPADVVPELEKVAAHGRTPITRF